MHFTSPIRRYPDLMVHRMLKVALFGRTGETSGLESALARIADHASTAERTAEEAARESQELKLFELLEQRIGDEVDGMISGVMAQGFFVRLADTCEGFVSLRDTGEYFVLDAARRVLFGSDSGVVGVPLCSPRRLRPCAPHRPQARRPKVMRCFWRAFSLRGVAVYSRFAIP